MAKRLNIGCGDNKLEGYINLDVCSEFKPDICIDIRFHSLPLDDDSVEEVVMFHTLEHIEKRFWPFIFDEINRVLCKDGSFVLTYPEFSKVLKNWLENTNGKREFWEATIYGRQTNSADYHVSACDTLEIKSRLLSSGFLVVSDVPETIDSFNNTLYVFKNTRTKTREDLLQQTVFGQNDYI